MIHVPADVGRIIPVLKNMREIHYYSLKYEEKSFLVLKI